MAATSPPSELLPVLNKEAQYLFVMLKTLESFCGTSGKMKLVNSIAPEFFVVVQEALVDAVILSIARLTDKQPRHGCSVTLELVVNAAFQPPSSVEESHVRKKLSDLKQLCQPLRERRNKGSAHNDKDYATGIKPLPAVSAQQFADAASLVQEIVNDIQKQVGVPQTGFDGGWIKTGGDLLLQKLVWALRWEQQEDAKYADSRLGVSDHEIENTDWTADRPISNSLPASSS